MDHSGWFVALLGFAVAMAATPGPNNVMVTASAATFGLRRSLPLTAGIAVGVAAIMLIVAAFGASIVADSRAAAVMKWAGVVYLVWLAWKIATAAPVRDASAAETPSTATPMSFMQGALLQLVNPKLWAMVSGGVLTYGPSANEMGRTAGAVLLAVVFGTATFVSTLAWAAVGASVIRLASPGSIRVFNMVMAALLLVSLVPEML